MKRIMKPVNTQGFDMPELGADMKADSWIVRGEVVFWHWGGGRAIRRQNLARTSHKTWGGPFPTEKSLVSSGSLFFDEDTKKAKEAARAVLSKAVRESIKKKAASYEECSGRRQKSARLP